MKLIILLIFLTSCGSEKIMFDWMEHVATEKGKELLAVCVEDLEAEKENVNCTYIEEEDEETEL